MTGTKTNQRNTPWLKTYTDLEEHPKTLHLAEILKIQPVHAVGHLVVFWHRVLTHREYGNLDGITPGVIARWSRWDGDANEFYEALLTAGWIEYDGEDAVVHDWMDYAGELIRRREGARKWRDSQRIDSVTLRSTHGNDGVSHKSKSKRKRKSTDKEVFATQTPGLPSGSPDLAPAKKRSVLTKECEDFCRYYATQVGFGKGDGDPHLILEAFRSRKKLFSPLQLNRLVVAWSRSKEWAKENGTYRANVLNFLTKERYTTPPPEAIGSLSGADYSKDDEDVR